MLTANAPKLLMDSRRISTDPLTNHWHTLPEAFRRCAANTIDSVLLETAKQDGENNKSFLFLNPVQKLVAWSAQELNQLCTEIDRQLANGMFVSGYFAYECGEHFVGLSAHAARDEDPSEPLAWLGVYAAAVVFNHSSGEIYGSLPVTNERFSISAEESEMIVDGLQISEESYHAALAQISRYLQDGHSYQVNFTDRVTGRTNSNPLVIYETLLRQQPVPFAAFIHRAEESILSFSPELFFRTTEGHITVRPMKGTWRRGNDLDEDRKATEELRSDEKNCSEHVMIVDLLRNDLGRICRYGSVRVENLFQVETYNRLLQMTSTCSGVLQDGLSPSQVFTSLFPSGSITGAPKRRTMEIIRELEDQRRGVYTGSIGYFGPNGEASFNVAIRTISLCGGALTMGVGGGITVGSKAEDEFEECRLKASFLIKRRSPFELIETMRCEGGITHLPLHLQRLADSAQYFGIRYNKSNLLVELARIVENCGATTSKVRVQLSEYGDWEITAEALTPLPWSGRLLLAEEQICSTDVWRRHKTTNRKVYEQSLAAGRSLGFDEVVFLNERSQLCEGTISNIFAQIHNTWVTPPLSSGSLPGIQRGYMLRSLQNAKEQELSIDDIQSAESIDLCNALRGARSVLSIQRTNGSIVWSKK